MELPEHLLHALHGQVVLGQATRTKLGDQQDLDGHVVAQRLVRLGESAVLSIVAAPRQSQGQAWFASRQRAGKARARGRK